MTSIACKPERLFAFKLASPVTGITVLCTVIIIQWQHRCNFQGRSLSLGGQARRWARRHENRARRRNNDVIFKTDQQRRHETQSTTNCLRPGHPHSTCSPVDALLPCPTPAFSRPFRARPQVLQAEHFGQEAGRGGAEEGVTRRGNASGTAGGEACARSEGERREGGAC